MYNLSDMKTNVVFMIYCREADHPKFVMWHKKWNEQEDTSTQGKETSHTNPPTVAPLQDLMNIVEQEDPSLNTKVPDTEVSDPSHQAHELNSDTTLEKTAAQESEETLDTNPAIFSETLELPKSDVEADDGGNKEMVPQKDLTDSNKETVNVENQPETSMTIVSEKENISSSEVSEQKLPEDSKEDEQKESCDSVEINCAQQNKDESDKLLSLETEPLNPGIKSATELGEVMQAGEKILDTVEMSSDVKKPEHSLQTDHKKEISMSKEEPESANDSVNLSSDNNTEPIKRDEAAPENTDDGEKMNKCKSPDGNSTQEASLSLPSPKELTNDEDLPEKCKSEEMDVEESVEVKEESKTDTSVESETTMINKEKIKECVSENELEIRSTTEDESQLKQLKSEDIKDDENVHEKDENIHEKDENVHEKDENVHEKDEDVHEKDETKTEDSNTDKSGLQEIITEEDSIIKEKIESPETLLKVEGESDTLKTESEEIKDEDQDQVKDTETKDVEQRKSPDSSSLATSGVSHPAAEDTLNEEEPHLEDGDDLALDLGGLGATGEGVMPGGSELAALLSSQTELEQLVSQASSALVPISSNVHSGIYILLLCNIYIYIYIFFFLYH